MNVRQADLEGVPHIVVPVVMLTVGTHHGSNGPIFYPGAELRRSVPLWNGKPIICLHSDSFASDPATWNRQKVGTIFGTRFDGHRLTAEAWLNLERARAVDPRIADAVAARRTLEVSTGVGIDVMPQRGDWNGKAYIGIAGNFAPDHLAILPDLRGACSISDGCGLLPDPPVPHFV